MKQSLRVQEREAENSTVYGIPYCIYCIGKRYRNLYVTLDEESQEKKSENKLKGEKSREDIGTITR